MPTTAFPPVFDREEVLKSYLGTLVWTGSISYMTGTYEFGGEPMTEDTNLDRFIEVDDLPDTVKASAKESVEAFLDEIEAELENYPRSIELTAESIGHDFCLTRNGHGAGFWDRGLGHLGEYLSKASSAHGSHNVSGSIILKNPRLPDPALLAWENLDHDTLKVWES